MNAQRNLAVIRFSDAEIEQAQKMQRRIREALTRGRNVVLICDAPMIRRMERLTFACLGVRDLPGRFAIVAQDVDHFSETIPGKLRDHLQVFESQDDAFDWIDPNPIDVNATLLELSMN